MVHSYTSGTVVAELLERGPDVTTSGTPKGRQLKATKKYDWLAVAILFVGAVVVLIFASLE
jgi:hypothetical protein